MLYWMVITRVSTCALVWFQIRFLTDKHSIQCTEDELNRRERRRASNRKAAQSARDRRVKKQEQLETQIDQYHTERKRFEDQRKQVYTWREQLPFNTNWSGRKRKATTSNKSTNRRVSCARQRTQSAHCNTSCSMSRSSSRHCSCWTHHGKDRLVSIFKTNTLTCITHSDLVWPKLTFIVQHRTARPRVSTAAPRGKMLNKFLGCTSSTRKRRKRRRSRRVSIPWICCKSTASTKAAAQPLAALQQIKSNINYQA